ncbi:MAG: hypothetical protein ACXWEY_09465 [Bacteroidia bacterium]
MNNQSRLLLAFLAGALAGVAVTYLASSDKGEEVVDEFKNMASKLKSDLAERMRRGPSAAPEHASAMGDNPEQYTGV